MVEEPEIEDQELVRKRGRTQDARIRIQLLGGSVIAASL